MIKKIFNKVPKLPLSALIFYLTIIILWKWGCIPSPSNIFLFLENLYKTYGLVGLFIATFLEGVVYFGLYFPGSFVVALAVIVSDGTFKSLISISIVVATALTMTSIINYVLGFSLASKFKMSSDNKKAVLSKGLFVSMLHPNALAFYFFNLGIKKENQAKILLVPIVMIPYGLFLAYVFYSIKEPLKRTLESPYLMITFITIWIFFAFLLERRRAVFLT
ncbi:MAG: DUF1295 domain-containing protein [bacterium]